MAKGDIPVVTEADVAQAVQDLEAARAEVVALRHAFVSGDESITQERISSQQGVVEWLELVLERTRNQHVRWEVEAAKQARADLKAEILAADHADGERLSSLLQSLHSAATEFVDVATAHDSRVRDWVHRAKALDVPDKGVISAAHEGLGTSAGGDVLVDDLKVSRVDAHTVLGLVFHPVENGVLPSTDESRVAAALTRVGKPSKAFEEKD